MFERMRVGERLRGFKEGVKGVARGVQYPVAKELRGRDDGAVAKV